MLNLPQFTSHGTALAICSFCLLPGQGSADEPIKNNSFRLLQIAQSLQSTQGGKAELIKEAVTLCGFGVRPEFQNRTQTMTMHSPLYLELDNSDVRDFSSMFQMGESCKLADLEAAFDYNISQLGMHFSCKKHLESWLKQGPDSSNLAVHNLTTFLNDLQFARTSGRESGIGADSSLDPLQTILITRVVSEEICSPIRKWLLSNKPQPLLASRSPVFFETPEPLPGWAEDLFVGAETGLYAESVEAFSLAKDNIGGYAKSVGFLNTFAGLVKFIASYAFLKGEISVVEGQPLVRTKKTDEPGEKRTLAAKFYFDASAASETAKSIRTYMAFVGIDTDAPQSGPLSGVDTSWEFGQSKKFASLQLIQTARGEPSPGRVPTDGDGIARLRMEGKPQTHRINEKLARPMEKTIPIAVSPQLKSANAKQAIVDGLMSALGVKGGPLGCLNIITETLYRVKWNVAARSTLTVQDWTDWEALCDLTANVDLSYDDTDKDHSYFRKIGSQIIARRVPVSVQEPEPIYVPEMPSAEVLKAMSRAQREGIKAAIQGAKEAKSRGFYTQIQSDGVVEVKLISSDIRRVRMDVGGCGQTQFWSHESDTVIGSSQFLLNPYSSSGDDSLFFTAYLDHAKNTARISLGASMKAHHHLDQSNPPGPDRIVDEDIAVRLTDYLTIDNKDGAIVVPLHKNLNPNGDVDIVGEGIIPIKVNVSDSKTAKGTMSVHLTFTRRKK